MRSTPRHRRSNIATHIGALLLLALWPAAAWAAEAEIAVQEVLPQLSLPARPSGLSLEGRVSRIEAIIPHLATKEDLQNAKAEMKADLQATEAKLERAIDKSRQATEAKLEKAIRQSQEATEAKLEVAIAKLGTDIANLRTEFSKEMREQLLTFLWINGGMAGALGGMLLLLMGFMLQLSKEVRQQNGQQKASSQDEGGEGGGEGEGSKRP